MTIAGKGCFVRATQSPLKKDVRRKLITEVIDDAVVQAHHLQIGKDELLRLTEERFDGFLARRTRAMASSAGTAPARTTTIKCLLNLVRPTGGSARLFGLDVGRHEVAVTSRLAYVPDQVAFYPWMSVRDTLGYLASFIGISAPSPPGSRHGALPGRPRRAPSTARAHRPSRRQ